MKKRVLSVVLFLTMLLSIVPPAANADVLKKDLPKVNASSYAIIDGESQQVLFGKDYNKSMDPGNLVQMMTAILIIENGNLNDSVVVPEIPEAANDGNRLYLRKGEKVNLNNLLEGIIIYNANDAAIAAANHLAGSQKDFVAEMNERAKELGMKDTTFASSYGSAKNQTSTAKDMAILAAHAESLPKYVELAIQPTLEWDSEMNQDNVINVNGMQEVEPEAVGLKIDSSENPHLTAGITKGSRVIVGAMLKCLDEESAYTQMQECLHIGLENTSLINLVTKGKTVTTMNFGKDKSVRVAPSKDYAVTTSQGNSNEFSTVFSLDKVKLPISEGDQVGVVKIYNGDEVLDEVPLKAENAAKASMNWWKIFAIFMIIFYIISMIFVVKNVNQILRRKHVVHSGKAPAHSNHPPKPGAKPQSKSHTHTAPKKSHPDVSHAKRRPDNDSRANISKSAMQHPSVGSNAGRQGLEQRLKDKKTGGNR